MGVSLALCRALQTRLPGELAAELEGIAGEFEADLVYYTADGGEPGDSDDSEAEGLEPLRPLRNFPAVALISAIHGALEARALCCLASLPSACGPA